MRHIQEIDGLRAWMAWWVVCQHVLQVSGIAQLYPSFILKFLTMGGLAVIVFVIISGFVIANLIVMKTEDYSSYIARRFLRIFPIYAIAVSANLFLQGAYYETFSQVPWSLEGHGARVLGEWENMPLHVALHFMLLHGVVPDSILEGSVSAILTPAWSLSLEWQYYIVAPLLVSSLFWRGWVSHIVSGVIAVVLIVFAYQHSPVRNWGLPAFLPLLVGFFMIGIISRMWFTSVSRAKLVFPVLIATLNFFLYSEAYTGGRLLVAAIPVVVWFAVLFAFGFRFDNKLFALFSRFIRIFVDPGFIRKLGTWSYSTYMIHVPVFVVALWLLRQSGLQITQYSYLVTLLLASLMLVPLSWFFYNFVEKRAVQAGNRWLDLRMARPRSSV